MGASPIIQAPGVDEERSSTLFGAQGLQGILCDVLGVPPADLVRASMNDAGSSSSSSRHLHSSSIHHGNHHGNYHDDDSDTAISGDGDHLGKKGYGAKAEALLITARQVKTVCRLQTEK
jgi:hypothetical protein